MERFMSVFHKLFLSLLVCTNLSACIELEEDLSDSQSPEAQAFKQQLTSNAWQSDGIPSNGQLVANHLTFHNNNEVSKLRHSRSSDGSLSEITSNADYSVGEKVTLPSGLMAFELNYANKSLSFDPDHISQSTSTPIELELAIIKDGNLYFGNANMIETCEGEYFERDIIDLSGSIIRGFYTECYARPTSINFDAPFRQVVVE
jgi:hypothetical protein